MTTIKPKRPPKALAYLNITTAAVPSKDVARAFKAMRAGKASDIQQLMVLDFIINDICRCDDLEFRPEQEGGYAATAFASGKRFAGQQVRSLAEASGRFIESLPD